MDSIQKQVDELVLEYQMGWKDYYRSLKEVVNDRSSFEIVDERVYDIMEADPIDVVRHLNGEEVLTDGEGTDLASLDLEIVPGHGRSYGGNLDLYFLEQRPAQVAASFYFDEMVDEPTGNDTYKMLRSTKKILEASDIEHSLEI